MESRLQMTLTGASEGRDDVGTNNCQGGGVRRKWDRSTWHARRLQHLHEDWPAERRQEERCGLRDVLSGGTWRCTEGWGVFRAQVQQVRRVG